jgi:serine/threonine-protein kinase
MIYVPAGSFEMGKNYDFTVEGPAHIVELDAFWIDKTLVTNAMYGKCQQDLICNPPNSTSSATRQDYYGNPDFDNFPVINVSWEDAQTYCVWADRRLPTEAEWEKTARGASARTYTWGNESPNSNLLNYDYNVGDTTAVDSYPDGASPYGALDMAGNVFQWVADWYSDTYYANSPLKNPPGPESGQYRVLKSGGWSYTGDFLRPSHRSFGDPAISSDMDIGFRCARSE